ncbi:MAG TPA: hypothetical protein VKM93_28120 [Terriglobia bacterium]|nr:hypothetical protein [Terriglobia bacterium]
MTRRLFVLLLGAVAALFLVMPAFAQGTAVILFSDANGDGSYGGFGAGIYHGTLNNESAEFICDDFTHEIGGGYYWQANVNTPDSNAVRFGSTATPSTPPSNPDLAAGKTYGGYTIPTGGITQAQEYDMIGYLVAQIFSHPSNASANAVLNGAIWAITDGAWDPSYNYAGSGAEADVEAAATAVLGLPSVTGHPQFDSQGYTVFTPTDNPTQTFTTPTGGTHYADGSAQEFWAYTPEPAAVVLLGWGALALTLGSLVRKKFLA